MFEYLYHNWFKKGKFTAKNQSKKDLPEEDGKPMVYISPKVIKWQNYALIKLIQ